MLRLAATVMKTKINVLAVLLARDQYLKLSSVLIAIAIDHLGLQWLPWPHCCNWQNFMKGRWLPDPGLMGKEVITQIGLQNSS